MAPSVCESLETDVVALGAVLDCVPNWENN
jgi:hypothetical protein